MVDSLRGFPVAPSPTPATDTFTRRSQLMSRLAQGEQVDPAEGQQLDMDALTSGNEFMTGLRAAGYSLAPTAKAFGGQMLETVAPEYSNQLIESARQDMEAMPTSLRPTYQTFAEAKDRGGFGGVMNKIAGAAGEAVPSAAAMGAGFLAGGPLGGLAAMVPLEGGETAMELRDDPAAMANTSPLERTGLTFGRGFTSAILENLGPQKVLAPALKSALRTGVGVGARPALQTIGSLAARDAVAEYGTEASQDLLGQETLIAANPDRQFDLAQANEAGLAGAVGGAMGGGLAGGIQAAATNVNVPKIDRPNPQAQGFQPDFDASAVIGRLRQFSENPEEAGKQASETVVSGISKAIDAAGELDKLYETLKPRIEPALQAAGETAASGVERGQELNNAIKDTLGEYVIKNVSDPEDQAWALDKIYSSSDAELGILKDALRAKDLDSFKQDMSMYLFTTGGNVGKSASNLAAWAKDFGKSATENLAGKFSTQTPEDRKAVYKSILDSFNTPEYNGVYSKIKNMSAAERTTVLRMFADAAENGTVAQMREAENDSAHPLHNFVKAWEADTHHSFSDSMAVAVSNRTSSLTQPVRDGVVDNFIKSSGVKSSNAPRIASALSADTYDALTAPQKGMLTKLARQARQVGKYNGEVLLDGRVLFAELQRKYNSALETKAGKNESSSLVEDNVKKNLMSDDIEDDAQADYQADDGSYRDADGNVMSVENSRRSFFGPNEINEVIADAKFTSSGNSHIPIKLSAVDEDGTTIPAKALASLFAYKFDGVKSAIEKPVIKDGNLVLNISPMSLAAMSRSPAFREISSEYRPEYDENASPNKNAGDAFGGMFMALLNDGIEADLGDKKIYISVSTDEEVLHDKLIINRKKGKPAYTMADYKSERTKGKKGLSLKDLRAREEILNSFSGNFRNAAKKLQGLSEKLSGALANTPKSKPKLRKDRSDSIKAIKGLLGRASHISPRDVNAGLAEYAKVLAEEIRTKQVAEELRVLKEEFFSNNLSIAEIDNLIEFYNIEKSARDMLSSLGFEPSTLRSEERARELQEFIDGLIERKRISDMEVSQDVIDNLKEFYTVEKAARDMLSSFGLEPITLRPEEHARELQEFIDELIERKRISDMEVSQKGDTTDDEADKAYKNYRSTEVFKLATEMANSGRESTKNDSSYVQALRTIKKWGAANNRKQLNKAYKKLTAALKNPKKLSSEKRNEYVALLKEIKDMATEMKRMDALRKAKEEEEAKKLKEAVEAKKAQEAEDAAKSKAAREARNAELNKEARDRFVSVVRKLVGNRVAIVFDSELQNDVSASYQSKQDALTELGNELRSLKKVLKQSPQDRNPQVSNEFLEAEIEMLMRKEKELLDDTAVLGMIRVATGRESMAGLAEHEAFHGAFSFFFTKEERRILTTAFTRGLVAKRLKEYFKDEPTVLEQLDDPEEAAAYGFQVWMYDPEFLKVGQQTKNLFQRFKEWLMKLIGATTPQEKAELIMRDFRDGVREQKGTAPLQRILDKDRPWAERAQKMARDIGELMGHFYDMGLTSTYERMIGMNNPMMEKIAKLGYSAVGESGNEGGMIQRVMTENKRLINKADRIFKDLNADQLLELHNAMIFDKPAADQEVRKRQLEYNALFEELYNYQKDAGVDIGKHTDGGRYYPLVWDAEKVLKNRDAFIKMLEKPEYAKQLKTLMKTPSELWDGIVSYLERGDELVNIMGDNDEPVSEASHKRSLGFISKEDRRAFMADDPIHTVVRYIKQAVRQTEFVRSYGEQGIVFKKLLKEASVKYGASVDEVALAKDYLDGLLGNKEVGMSRELKDLYGALSVYQNYRLLPFSLLSSLVDPMGIAIRSNSLQDAFDTFSYSMKNLFKEWKKEYTRDQWEAIAEDWGIIENAGTTINAQNMYEGVTLRGKTKELNDGLFKYNLLNGWIRNNTIMAVKAAQRFFYRSATETFGEHGKRHLEELGLSVDDIIYNQNLGRILLTAAELEAAGKTKEEAAEIETRLRNATDKFVRQALLNPSAAELPNWASNPYLAPIAHLKNFVWAFNATITKQVMHELEHKNYKPVMLATAYVPGMIAADFIKDMVSNAGEEPPYKKDWGVLDYIGQGVKRSGFTGVGQFFTEAREDMVRGGSGVESFVGPSLGQMQRGVRALASGDETKMWNWLVKAGPFSVAYDQSFTR